MSSNLPIDLAEDASSFNAALLHVRYWHLADIGYCTAHVCFWPKADIGSLLNDPPFNSHPAHFQPLVKPLRSIVSGLGWS